MRSFAIQTFAGSMFHIFMSDWCFLRLIFSLHFSCFVYSGGFARVTAFFLAVLPLLYFAFAFCISLSYVKLLLFFTLFF